LIEKADIHCHVLPYVDDGAMTIRESMELIEQQYEQGVRAVCMTPHLRKNMFETSDEKISREFSELNSKIREFYPDLRTCLSREYHCDPLFLSIIREKKIMPMGERYVLTEFSYSDDMEEIEKYLSVVMEEGYVPVIAHAERCEALRDFDILEDLSKREILIQMNASSILGKEGRRQAAFCRKAVKRRLIDIVASDAHDPEYRPVLLNEAEKVITRLSGEGYTRRIMHDVPMRIMGLEK